MAFWGLLSGLPLLQMGRYCQFLVEEHYLVDAGVVLQTHLVVHVHLVDVQVESPTLLNVEHQTLKYLLPLLLQQQAVKQLRVIKVNNFTL